MRSTISPVPTLARKAKSKMGTERAAAATAKKAPVQASSVT
jgi:hypothetical protein